VKYRYTNVHIICIYGLNLRSNVKFNKGSKETTFIKKHFDIQHGLARILFHLKQWTVSIDRLSVVLTNSQIRVTGYVEDTIHG
jgi:hypothetical protein